MSLASQGETHGESYPEQAERACGKNGRLAGVGDQSRRQFAPVPPLIEPEARNARALTPALALPPLERTMGRPFRL